MHFGGKAAVRTLEVQREAIGVAQLRGRGRIALALAQAPDQHVVAIDERLDGVPELPIWGCVKGAAARKLDCSQRLNSRRESAAAGNPPLYVRFGNLGRKGRGHGRQMGQPISLLSWQTGEWHRKRN